MWSASCNALGAGGCGDVGAGVMVVRSGLEFGWIIQ